MLSTTLSTALNRQITLEFESSNLYLQVSSWCMQKGLEGCAGFFREHADEERMHMQKMFDYVNETGSYAVLDPMEKPKNDFESIVEVFKITYAHEQMITKEINNLVSIAFKEGDFSTFNFLQWYVEEQHEEEQLFKSVLDKIDLIGMAGNGLFFIDQEVAKMRSEMVTESAG